MESRLYITITTVFTSFILSSVFGRLYRNGTVIPKVSVQGVLSLGWLQVYSGNGHLGH